MASGSPNSKNPKMDATTSRSTIAKPILAPEFTEDPPLEEVYIGIVKQKKDISMAIQSISNILPGFHHLKRCSSNRLLLAPLRSRASLLQTSDKNLLIEEQRKSYTKEKDFNSILHEDSSSGKEFLTEQELKSYLKQKDFNLSLLEDHFQVFKVPSRVPRTKSQAARVSKIWPVNFHPDPNLESLIDGSIFEERQYELIENYMKVVIEAARLEAVGNADCNGAAMIVDPEDGRILVIAASKIDQHPMWHAAMLAVDLVASLQGGGAWKLHEQIQNDSKPNTVKRTLFHDKIDIHQENSEKEIGKTTSLCDEKTSITMNPYVATIQSCSDLKSHENIRINSEPKIAGNLMLQEEIIVRRKECGKQDDKTSSLEYEDKIAENTEREFKRKYKETTPLCYPEILSRISLPVQESLKRNIQRSRRSNTTSKIVDLKSSSISIESMDTDKCGPYLCTGYWAFLLKEPCPLCAMALLHSRVLRIFYGIPNRRTGVLGSKAILHAVPGLNHRYQVWSGILEQKCQEISEEIESKNIR